MTPVQITASDWASILELANMWQMKRLSNMAINALNDHLKDMVPEEKIALGMKWKQRWWVKEGARAIVVQGHAMSKAQMETIGFLAASQLAMLRELLGGYLKSDHVFVERLRVPYLESVQSGVEDAVRVMTMDWTR